MRIPSPTNAANTPFDDGWHLCTKNYTSVVPGFIGENIGSDGFYMTGGSILQTNGWKTSATSSTIGDGGQPEGSTELDDDTGHNCKMSKERYKTIATRIYGLEPTSYAVTRGNSPFVNLLLDNFVAIVNINVVRKSNIPHDKLVLGKLLARATLLHIGKSAISHKIIEQVWGNSAVIRNELGGIRGDLQQTGRRLTLNSRIAANYLYIWTNGTNPLITDEGIDRLPGALRHIFHLRRKHVGTCDVRMPISMGEDCTKILMDNLRDARDTPETTTFEDKAIQWYTDFLLHGDTADDDTGMENGIFAAYGVDF